MASLPETLHKVHLWTLIFIETHPLFLHTENIHNSLKGLDFFLKTGKIIWARTVLYISKSNLTSMPASWSRSRTLGIKQKAFSWRIDGRGNIFIKRKFRRARFPRIDKISCIHLERLCRFMQDMEWKDLANDAAKLYTGTEKDGIGKFLYRLRPEIPYAQLSSHLAAIFYHSEVWKWNEQRRGMKFSQLSEDWQQRTMQYYLISLNLENDDNSLDRPAEYGIIEPYGLEEQEEIPQKIKQTKLSAFFGY
jgi:hypothetical protein